MKGGVATPIMTGTRYGGPVSRASSVCDAAISDSALAARCNASARWDSADAADSLAEIMSLSNVFASISAFADASLAFVALAMASLDAVFAACATKLAPAAESFAPPASTMVSPRTSRHKLEYLSLRWR